MKILCVLLPHFRLNCEIMRHPGLQNQPAVVFSGSSSRRSVLDFSPGLEGLRPEMSLEQAVALHGNIELLGADPPFYRSCFEEIMDGLQTISPLVENSRPGLAYIESGGLELLYPEEAVLAAAIINTVPAVFESQLGMAEGKFPAYLAASRSLPGSWYSLNGNLHNFLRDIPCGELPVSLKSKNKLAAFGLSTLGEITGLPRSALEAQFGPEGRIIHQLAAGYDPSPLVPRLPREIINARVELETATGLIDIMLTGFECLLFKVFAALGPKNMGINRLDIWTHTLSGECLEKSIFFKTPAMQLKTALDRIGQVFETWPQPAPVCEIGIKVTGLGRPAGRQKSLIGEVRSTDNLLGDIHQLELKLGGPQLFKFKEAEPWSRIPERRHVLTPLSW